MCLYFSSSRPINSCGLVRLRFLAAGVSGGKKLSYDGDESWMSESTLGEWVGGGLNGGGRG